VVDIHKELYGVSKDELMAAKKAQLGLNPSFTPEHSGVADNGRALTINEAFRGGGLVVDKKTLEAQREGDWADTNFLSMEAPIINLRREAQVEAAEEAQADSEKQAKHDEREAKKAEREEERDQKAAKPVKIVEDKTTDKPAV